MKYSGSGWGKITIEADSKVIDKAIENAVKHLTKDILDEIGKAICEFGVETAKAEAPKDTGALRDSIRGSYKDGVVTITAGTDHSLFVEFGTGIVGKGTYPEDANVYEYDVHNHGALGWTYKLGDKYIHTIGHIADPYMYRTLKKIDENINRIIKDTLKRLGLW